jgi:hypothetical protein
LSDIIDFTLIESSCQVYFELFFSGGNQQGLGIAFEGGSYSVGGSSSDLLSKKIGHR